MPISKSKIILGIDPGLATIGWGVIKIEKNNIEAIDWGIISTKKNKDFKLRLLEINKDLKKLINKHKPSLVAVEELYFCKNVTTALTVGQARGVILLTIANQKLPIIELTPLQVKQSISGYGKADKSQVQKMVKITLNLNTIPKPDDAADALAIAISASGKDKYNQLTR